MQHSKFSELVRIKLKNATCPVTLALAFLCIGLELQAAQESIISKKDADFVFGLSELEWEKNAPKFFAPGWDVRLSKHETGTGVAAYNPSNGYGVSVQPIYRNDRDKPEMVIVGNYFPVGALPPMTEDMKRSLESAARKDLGPAYSVRLTYSKTEKLELIELFLTKAKSR